MQNGAGGGVWTSTYRFNPSNNIWDDASIADLPAGRYAASGDFLNGRWLLAGGYAYPSSNASVIAWNPANNSWQPLPDVPQPRYFAAGGTIGQAFYAVGGQDDASQRSNFTRRYLEVPCTTFTPTPGPSPTPNPATATPGGPTPCPIQFADVAAGNTFYATIRCLACRGIVGGYPCGGPGEPCPGTYFRPNNNVTRGQVSKIVSESAGFQDVIPSTQQAYEDIAPGSTFHLWIERLAMRNIISGYPCGGAGEPCVAPGNRPYFRPANNATRGQMSKIAAQAFFPNCQTPAAVKP
jgi:hypothetical protein